MSDGWPDARHTGPQPPHPDGSASHPPNRRGAKAVVAVIALVLLVVFVIRNSQRVAVDFIVVTGHPRMIWVIVTCTILGGAVGFFLGRPARSRRQRSSGSPGGGTPKP